MPKPRKPSPAKVFAGLEVPRSACPFSGDPLEFVPITTLAAGHEVVKWQVRGSGWTSTKLFDERAHAEWFFSHDHGVKPAFRNPHARVEVVGERLPPDPAEAEAKSQIRDAEKIGEAMAEELTK